MDKTALASETLIDAIIKQKEERHLTCAQLAQMCGVPESTVTKVFNHSIKSPSIDTLIPLAQALDISIDTIFAKAVEKAAEKTAAASSVPAKMLVSQEEKFLNLFIDAYNKQIEELQEENRNKSKWIKALVAIIVLYALVFAAVTLLALAHHDISLLQSTSLSINSLLSL